MDSLGLFDPDLRSECRFDLTAVIEAWFDREMVLIGTSPTPPVPPVPPLVRGERLRLGPLTEGGTPTLSPVLATVNILNIGRISGIRIGSPTVKNPRLGLGPLTRNPPK